jgi:hypothetical protein
LFHAARFPYYPPLFLFSNLPNLPKEALKGITIADSVEYGNDPQHKKNEGKDYTCKKYKRKFFISRKEFLPSDKQCLPERDSQNGHHLSIPPFNRK